MSRATANTVQPFFSIVIPTFNRPEYLSDCLYSLLHQSYTDYECIVSDNFNDEKTYAVIRPHLSNPRLKYIRTSSPLNMMEHWEWASRQASGKYVLILSDRKLLYKKGLERACKILREYPDIACCSVRHKLYDEQKHTTGWSMEMGKTRLFSTGQLIDNLLHEDRYGASSLDTYFPKSLNGFYLNSFASRVREKYGSYFNLPGTTTPDYSSFMINCALLEKSLFIGENIILTQGENISTGKKFGSGKYDEYVSSLRKDDLYRHVPVKAPYTYNLLITDFITVKEKITGHLISKDTDWKNYLFVCLKEFYLYKNPNPDLEEALKRYHLTAWEKGADSLVSTGKISPEELKEIRFSAEHSLPKEKVFLSWKISPKHIRASLIHRYGHLHIINRIFPHRFKSALEAAGFRIS